MDVENEIIHYLDERINDPSLKVDAQTSLIAKGLLDSLDLLDLMEFMERRFQIKLDSADLNPDDFENPGLLAALVHRKASGLKSG